MAVRNFIGWETGQLNSLGTPDGEEIFNGGGTLSTTTVRTGTYALRVNPSAVIARTEVSEHGADGAKVDFNDATLYYRTYFRWASHSDVDAFMSALDTALAVKLNLKLTADDKIEVFDAGGDSLTTGATVLNANQWYRIGLKCETGASAGWEVEIDGNAEVSGTVDDVGTVNNGRLRLGSVDSSTFDFFYDDVLIDDAEFPGPGQSRICKATGNGTDTAWTGDFNDVDDLPNDGTTTIILTSDDPNAETVNVEDTDTVGIGGVINGVKNIAIARRLTNAATNIQARLRSGGSTVNTTDYDITKDNFELIADIHATDPATSAAWTRAGIDAVEAGVLHNQAQSRQLDCTAIYVSVDYTPASLPGPSVRKTRFRPILRL